MRSETEVFDSQKLYAGRQRALWDDRVFHGNFVEMIREKTIDDGTISAEIPDTGR